MLGNEIGRLRLVGIFEGISFLLLLGVAMPLKYIWHQPEAVRVVGMAHGILFLLYCLALVLAWPVAKWSFRRAAMIFLCALLPAGPFFMERSLRRDEATLRRSTPGT